MRSRRGFSSVVWIFAFAACSGDDPSATESNDTGGSTESGDSAADLCGDGVLDPGEVCDPPGDACGPTCTFVDRSSWTVTRGEPGTSTHVFDITVDPTGRILVFGTTALPADGEWGQESPWLLALDADGVQQWQVTVPQQALSAVFKRHLAADASGIFVQGDGVHRFTLSGEHDWTVQVPDRGFAALTLADGIVYTTGAAFEYDADTGVTWSTLVVHALDAATGAPKWDYLLADDTRFTTGAGVVVIDGVVLVVGSRELPGGRPDTLYMSLDAATGVAGEPVIDGDGEIPVALVGLPSGEVALAGFDEAGAFVRRFRLGGEALWTTELGEVGIADLAVGPDGGFVAGGVRWTDAGSYAFLWALSRTGEPTGSAGFAPLGSQRGSEVIGVAFAPDLLVVAGQDFDDSSVAGWIRRVELSP